MLYKNFRYFVVIYLNIYVSYYNYYIDKVIAKQNSIKYLIYVGANIICNII